VLAAVLATAPWIAAFVRLSPTRPSRRARLGRDGCRLRPTAKIMRPAVVWSTEVTTALICWPMNRLPWSTTTIVPSSR
jgi:hypothetical protein